MCPACEAAAMAMFAGRGLPWASREKADCTGVAEGINAGPPPLSKAACVFAQN